jgi:hypothetical protein
VDDRPAVEIGVTDLPKSGGAMTPPATPGTSPLEIISWISPLEVSIGDPFRFQACSCFQKNKNLTLIVIVLNFG